MSTLTPRFAIFNLCHLPSVRSLDPFGTGASDPYWLLTHANLAPILFEIIDPALTTDEMLRDRLWALAQQVQALPQDASSPQRWRSLLEKISPEQWEQAGLRPVLADQVLRVSVDNESPVAPPVALAS